MSIPRDQWRWSGGAGHFICSYQCRFHLRTEVGDFLISTVGDRYSGGPREDEYKREGMGGYIREEDKCYFETYVFRLGSKKCAEADCGCDDREVEEWGEIDGTRWKLRGEAQRGHYDYCQKYADYALESASGTPAKLGERE